MLYMNCGFLILQIEKNNFDLKHIKIINQNEAFKKNHTRK